MISERINAGRRKEQRSDLEKFNLDHQPQVSPETLRARLGCVLVAVRDSRLMYHLERVLEKTNLRRQDVVVMTVRQLSAGTGEYELRDDQLFADFEQELFSHVVSVAEKKGKSVELLVVPAVDPFDAIVQTASNLKAALVVTGVSTHMASEELARRIGLAWERLPPPRHPFSLEVIGPDRPSIYVNLGPHPPRLWPEDVDRLHNLWLRLTGEYMIGCKLHHRDVVGVALQRLEQELDSDQRSEILAQVDKTVQKHE
jgi:nucleotide-binding universal stress UspA family protein